jgi:hypothetical protein
MSESEPGSLILAEQEKPAQLSFFEEDAYELLESANGGYEFTGERLFAREPRKYQLCVKMIAEGLATRQIARALQVSPNTVEAVRKRERIPIEAEKESILQTVRVVTRLCAERVMELAPTMLARDASIAFGIFAEKMQLLSGEATHIVGKEEQIRHADFNKLIESLPAANAHEVPAMGFEGDPKSQKGPLPSLPDQDPPLAGPPSADPQRDSSALAPGDWQSLGLQSKVATRNALRNVSAPDCGEFEASEGGRGGSLSGPPATPLD